MSLTKNLILYAIVIAPLLFVFGLFAFFLYKSDFLKNTYMNSVRNLYFDCIEYTGDKTVYRLKSGTCRLDNYEYKTIITSNEHGHREVDPIGDEPSIAILGDSHAHGFGVNDKDVFASVLASSVGRGISNFSIGSYDTVRELEALSKFITTEKHVIIQYCDNDFRGNKFFIDKGLDAYLRRVETGWRSASDSYFERKDGGFSEILRSIPSEIFYAIKQLSGIEVVERDLEDEARVLVAVLTRYADLLEGKNVVIFESSSWGRNAAQFKSAVENELLAVNSTLNVNVLDSTEFLSSSEYYFFDDHLNVDGHKAIAKTLESAL